VKLFKIRLPRPVVSRTPKPYSSATSSPITKRSSPSWARSGRCWKSSPGH